MGKLILVTGGAKSGKSTFAENMCKEFDGGILYIATAIPFDDEMKLKIKRHREQRPSHWETVEAYRDFAVHLEGKLSGKAAALLDCITVMISNIILEQIVDWDNIKSEDILEFEGIVKKEIFKLLEVVAKSSVPFVVVTNEVGMGIVPDNALARVFRDIAGSTNQLLAKAADEVYLCVSGIPVKIKG